MLADFDVRFPDVTDISRPILIHLLSLSINLYSSRSSIVTFFCFVSQWHARRRNVYL